MAFDDWFKKRFPEGWWFGDIDKIFLELDKEFEREFKEMQQGVPKDMVREQRLPDGTIRKEWGPFIYGYSMTFGPDGKPIIREFGNVRPRLQRQGPPKLEFKGVREPLVDVMDEGDSIHVIAELPGVEKQDIKLTATESSLTISAERDGSRFHKEIELPAEVEPTEAKSTFRNGILDVKLKKVERKPKGHEIRVE